MNPVEEFLAYDQSDLHMEKTAQVPLAGSWAARHPVATGTMVTLGTPLAAMALHEGYQEVKGMIGRARGFKRMMDYNPKLKKLPATKTKAMFNTLHNAAPDLAKDPVVASSFVNRMALNDDYVDPRTLSDLGAAQQKVQRPGLEFPISSVTSSMSTMMSDPLFKQLDRAQKTEDAASTLAIKQRQFEHLKTRDAAEDIRLGRAEQRLEAGEARNKIEHAMRRSSARREKQLHPGRLNEQSLKLRDLRGKVPHEEQMRPYELARAMSPNP